MYPAFIIAPGMKPRTVCFCQPIWSAISTSVAPWKDAASGGSAAPLIGKAPRSRGHCIQGRDFIERTERWYIEAGFIENFCA